MTILQFEMSDENFQIVFHCLAGYAPAIRGFSHHGRERSKMSQKIEILRDFQGFEMKALTRCHGFMAENGAK